MFCDLVGSTAPSVRLDRGSARDHPPPITAASPTMSTASTGSSPSTWATGCWSISATRGLTRMMPSGSSGCAGLNRQCRSARRLDVKSVKLQARFGIATGLVVVGDLIGEGSAQEQSVVGDTPNLAARLQSLAEPNAVVIAAGTRRLVGDLFEYRDLGAVEIKGIAGPVPAWQVLRLGAIAS